MFAFSYVRPRPEGGFIAIGIHRNFFTPRAAGALKTPQPWRGKKRGGRPRRFIQISIPKPGRNVKAIRGIDRTAYFPDLPDTGCQTENPLFLSS